MNQSVFHGMSCQGFVAVATASTKRWLKAFWRAPAEQTFSWGHSGGEEFPIFLAGLFGGPVQGSSLILDPHPSVFFFCSFPGAGVLGGAKTMV